MRITFDITPRLEKAVLKLAEAFQHPWPVRFDTVECSIGPDSRDEHDVEPPEKAPESASKDEDAVIPPESEKAQEPPAAPQESAPMPEPVEPAKEITPAPVEKPVEKPSEAVEKPKRSRAKKADMPKPEAETVDPLTGEVLPDRKAESAEKIDAPAVAEPAAPAAQDSDPMQGMTVIQALQAITREASERGVDMAAMNGRIRAKADELGLTYGSAACLIKAVGYVEARRVALGER